MDFEFGKGLLYGLDREVAYLLFLVLYIFVRWYFFSVETVFAVTQVKVLAYRNYFMDKLEIWNFVKNFCFNYVY